MVASADLSTQFALDVQAVDGLRIASKKTGQAGLEAAARQFEALFLNMLLKSMRDATPQDGIMDSEQSRLYISMLDQQLSQSMAARGIGLAEIMIRQLRQALPPDPAKNLNEPDRGQLRTIDQPGQMRLSPEAKTGDSTRPPVLQKEPDAITQSASPQDSRQSAGGMQNSLDAAGFHDKLMTYAQEAGGATGIPARFLLGQAALESGWGRREIRSMDGLPSYNLFGIKAGPSWKGPVVEAVTTEYVDGVARKTVEKFRAYHSYADAFRDYANLLRSNPRYAGILIQAQRGISVEQFAQGLQQAGYATDPNYAEKLSRIIRNSGQS